MCGSPFSNVILFRGISISSILASMNIKNYANAF